MDLYFPDSGWLRLRRDTLDALLRYQSRHAVPTADEVLTPGRCWRRAEPTEGGGVPDTALTRAVRAGPRGGRRGPLRGLPALPVPRLGGRRTSSAGSSGCWCRPPTPSARSANTPGPRPSAGRAPPARAAATGACVSCRRSPAPSSPTPATVRAGCLRSSVDGTWITWDETVELSVDLALAPADLVGCAPSTSTALRHPGGARGRAVARRRPAPAAPARRGRCPAAAGWSLAAAAEARRCAAADGSRSRTPTPTRGRPAPAALRAARPLPDRGAQRARAAAGPSCRSLDPPEWAKAAVPAATTIRTWPVLLGPEGSARRCFPRR